jgi:inosine-uridine nucleoside N-ribohydrolase
MNELSIVGLSAVAGNAPLKHTAENARKLLASGLITAAPGCAGLMRKTSFPDAQPMALKLMPGA